MGRRVSPPISVRSVHFFFAVISLASLFSAMELRNSQAFAQTPKAKRVQALKNQRILRQNRINGLTPNAGQKTGDLSPAEVKQQEKRIRQLLRLMLKPLADFAGSESTWVNNANGVIQSQQDIKGDTKGRVVRRFLSPAFVKDDVMFTGGGKYFYYHARQKTIDREGLGAEAQLEKFIQEGLNAKSIQIQITGHQIVADRDATILLVSTPSAGVTLWLDSATGIKLSHEIRDQKGNPVSRSWVTKIAVGAEAGITDADFQVKEIEGAVPADLRENFKSIADARAKTGMLYIPLMPENLPPGFKFRHITVITPQKGKNPAKVSILHFSDGVTNFTLQERPILRPKLSPPEDLSKRPNRWRMTVQGGELEVNFKGRLSPEQVKALHDSLK